MLKNLNDFEQIDGWADSAAQQQILSDAWPKFLNISPLFFSEDIIAE